MVMLSLQEAAKHLLETRLKLHKDGEENDRLPLPQGFWDTADIEFLKVIVAILGFSYGGFPAGYTDRHFSLRVADDLDVSKFVRLRERK